MFFDLCFLKFYAKMKSYPNSLTIAFNQLEYNILSSDGSIFNHHFHLTFQAYPNDFESFIAISRTPVS
jgi:hypothetical protein